MEVLEGRAAARKLWTMLAPHQQAESFQERLDTAAELAFDFGVEGALELVPVLEPWLGQDHYGSQKELLKSLAGRVGTSQAVSDFHLFQIHPKLTAGLHQISCHLAGDDPLLRRDLMVRLAALEPDEATLQILMELVSRPPPTGESWSSQGPWGRVRRGSRENTWSDSPGTRYDNDEDRSCATAWISLDGLTCPSVSLDTAYDLENGYDRVSFQVRPRGGDWQTLKTFTGTRPEFERERFDLGAWSDQSVQFRFRLVTDGSTTREGWLSSREPSEPGSFGLCSKRQVKATTTEEWSAWSLRFASRTTLMSELNSSTGCWKGGLTERRSLSLYRDWPRRDIVGPSPPFEASGSRWPPREDSMCWTTVPAPTTTTTPMWWLPRPPSPPQGVDKPLLSSMPATSWRAVTTFCAWKFRVKTANSVKSTV